MKKEKTLQENKMSVENVKKYLEKFNLEERVKEFEESSATVDLAAKAVGVEMGKIAKTMSFKLEEGAILIVTAGDRKIDNHKFKEKFSTKAKMLNPEEVVFYTGHMIGGVCPFDLRKQEVKVYLDLSMKRFDKVFPAAGSSNSCVELTLEELFMTSNATEWIDVCKEIE
jgi:prolyl-tRNA editing enzyme YbaK/EbsC (Cys-tRNA(Pro) deacylase)